jgi:imidazolonepropionase-like amidohydrolase
MLVARWTEPRFHRQMHAIRAEFAFDGERFVEGGATVLVDGTAIVGVESASYVVPDGCPVTDHGAATVLPGLIDVHVHLVADSGPMALDRVAGFSADELDAVVTEALTRHLAAGVTTVRDLGDRRFNVVDRRDRQRTHDDGLPWIVASGPPITSPGGHCHYLGGEVATPEDIVAAVRERVARGVDIVKVMASGGMNTPGTDVSAPQFSDDDLRLLVEQAHRAGLPVTAHSHAAAGIDQAVVVGVDGIEHGSYLVAGGPAGLAGLVNVHATDQQLEALAASSIPVCPTLGGLTPEFYRKAPPHVQQMIADAGVTPEEIVATRMALLDRMHHAGVRFVSGTDAGIVPPKAHGLFANAVVELAQVLTVPEVLATATSDAARVCGLAASKGRLRAGYDADVLVVDGNLAVDVTALRHVRQVVVRGRVSAG